MIVALEKDASGVKHWLNSVTFWVVGEFLSKVSVGGSNPFADVNVVDLPAVRFVM